MKICYLADAQSVHTQRWACSIKDRGIDVIIISFRYAKINGIPVFVIKTPKIFKISPSSPMWSRYHYLFGLKQARKIINKYNPDILHAFWATSYGFLGARINHKNFLISVWGSDIVDLPRNFIITKIMKYILNKAKLIFCTSQFLLTKTKRYVDKRNSLCHIHFGVSHKDYIAKEYAKNNKVIIGSTKYFESKYGLKNLINAFYTLSKKYNNIELRLYGGGSEKDEMYKLIEKLDIADRCLIGDKVKYEDIARLLSSFDIYVMPSISDSETFGVSALEASATGIPVVGTRVGGIPEVVIHERTGILVEKNNIYSLIEALEKLIESKELRIKYGNTGREFVKENYRWRDSVELKVEKYSKVLKDTCE